jgi:hypothetical protein
MPIRRVDQPMPIRRVEKRVSPTKRPLEPMFVATKEQIAKMKKQGIMPKNDPAALKIQIQSLKNRGLLD